MQHPETQVIAEIVPSGVGGAAKNGICVNVSRAQKVEIWCFNRKGADATQCTWTLAQATGNAGNAAGTGEKAMTNNVPIYYSDAYDSDSTLTAATAAKAYQQAVTQSVTQVCVFCVVPEQAMDVANSFDTITVNATDPGAANSVHAFAIITPRYSPLPNALTD
jgi:hypothetical protein